MKTTLLAAAAILGLSLGANAQGLVIGTGTGASQSDSGTANAVQGSTGINSRSTVLGLSAGGVTTSARASGAGATSGFAGFTAPLSAVSGANNEQTNAMTSNTAGFTAGLGLGATTILGGSAGASQGASQTQAGASLRVLGGGLFR